MLYDCFQDPLFDFELIKYTCFDVHNRLNDNDLNSVQRLVKEIKDTINSIQECDYVKTNIQTYPFSPDTPTRYSISIKISSDIQSDFIQYLLKLINDSTEFVKYESYNNGFVDVSYDKTRILELLNSFI